MRLSSSLGVAALVAGLLSVGAALLAMPDASLLWAVVTLGALCGHAFTASGTPRVRWGAAAGAGMFALVAAANLLWHRQQAADAGEPARGQPATRAYLLESWQDGMDRQRLTAWGLVLGVLLLAVAVSALPARGGRRGVVTAVLAVAALVWCGLSAATTPGEPPLPDLADAALDGVEAGAAEVLADQWSRDVKSRLTLKPEEFNAAMDRALAALTT
ncbi:aminopeptidase [Micromonospora sp. NPDC005686]|uniref:aminopeptidase n=1 Tax=unclassified Micromonospora TaxID=2617518 RepID=UPI0033AD9D48